MIIRFRQFILCAIPLLIVGCASVPSSDSPASAPEGAVTTESISGDSATAAIPSSEQAYYELLGSRYGQGDDLNILIDTLETELSTSANDSARRDLVNAIWRFIGNLPDQQLDSLSATANSYELRGWIELARVVRVEQFSIRSQLDAINRWRRIWGQHIAAGQLPQSLVNLEAVWNSRPRQIALILPVRTPAGIAIQEGFFSAYYQTLSATREVPQITVFDSSDVSDVSTIYQQAVATGAELIVGPLNKELVNQLASRNSLPVTTLALNYADEIDSLVPNLYQFGLAPEDEIGQATAMAWNAGYRNAALLTPASSDYERLRLLFADRWLALGGNLVTQANFAEDGDYSDVIKRVMAIDSSEARAERLLTLLPRSNMEFTPRGRQDIDFLFLMANPRQGRQIKPTLAFYFAEDLPVYALPSINDGIQNPDSDQDLNDIIFTDAPWLFVDDDPLKSQVLENLTPTQGPLQRLRALGVDSFRMTTRLQQLVSGELPFFGGTTGDLRLSSRGQIRRELLAARFVGGLAMPIPASELNHIP